MDMVRGLLSRASSSFSHSPANFLRISEENVQRINNLVTHRSKNISILNERQCGDLSSKLANALEGIQELIRCCGASSTGPFTPAFENFFRISEKAKLLVLSCSSAKWWEASVFQLQNQEAFREILVEVGLCYNVIYEQAKDIMLNREERDFQLLNNLFQSSKWMFTAPSIADVQTDQKILQKRLEELTNNRPSINSLKQSLARYLLGNLRFISQAEGHGTEGLDMCGAMLWDHETEPPGTWTEMKYIGASTSPVFKTTWLDIPCAKKVFRAPVEDQVIFEKEVRILTQLNHPNIVKFMCCGNGAKNGQCFIGMELMQTSLSELIKVRGEERKPFPSIVAVDIIVQIARGMCCLHDLGIAHRDLKTPNVVVNKLHTPYLVENFCVKLIDFGLSRTKLEVSKSVTISSSGIGTTIYRAPEVHPKARTPEGHRLRKAHWFRADVYSFGITCAEILSLRIPFKNVPLSTIHEELLSGRRPDLPEDYPEKLLSLVKECWNGEPHSRPTFLNICTRLEEIRFDLLMKRSPTDGEGLLQVKTDDMSYKPIETMLKRCSLSRTQFIANSDIGEQEIEFEEDLEVPRIKSADKEYSSRIRVGQFIDLFKRESLHWGTNMSESDIFELDEYIPDNKMPFICEHMYELLLAPDNNDLICIKKFGTETNSTEIHILNKDSKYQQYRWQSGSCLHECTSHNFVFALAQNRDLFAIKRHQTGTGHTEVHILSASSSYQKFSLQIGTPLEESIHDTYQFLVAANRDLYAIKKSNTGTNRTEVHVLSASSNYQTYVLHATTCLIETNLCWDFIGLGENNDMHAVRRQNSRLGTTKMYILTRASEYKALNIVVDIQPLPKTDHKFAFALARNLDLFVIQKTNTTSGNVDLQVLSFSSKYQELQSQYSTTLPETEGTCEVFGVTESNDVPDQDLVLVKRNYNGNRRKTAVYIFRNQAGFKVLCDHFYTILDQTNHTFDFGLAKNRDLFVVNKSNTGPSCATEIHILDGSTKYSSFKLQTGTPLPKTDHTWKFLVAENRDLIAIQKSNTSSRKTEVCILTAASAYQSFGVQGCSTVLEETDDAWDFLMAPNNDLLAIHKYNTKSGHTEINVLSSKSNYQEFTFQAPTDLPETDYNITFILTSDLTLVPIRKSQYPFSWNLA